MLRAAQEKLPVPEKSVRNRQASLSSTVITHMILSMAGSLYPGAG